ncbi:MAG: SUMF1/EgtB/PvdO family nonheme iron enzyme [Planctomycetes bacterium]|nr:SUMF1/EgtB/PvdO family nonheme iron enzyme [Planctomycetota bacterium]
MPGSSADDSDAFVAAFLQRRLADRAAGVESSLAEYCRQFPGRESLVRAAWDEAAAEVVAPPRTIGPYRLLERLGQGGQGDVWLGEDPRLARRVAIKLLRGMAFASADALVRFRREAQAASRLDHPGICPVFDAGFEGGVPYLVMRYLEGRSLATALAELVPQAGPERDAAAERVARIVERLARALHAAHEAGVLHRDIKPQNVVLVAGETPVLLDFGLAQLVDDDTLFTRTGPLAGTPAYLPPEQLGVPPTPPGRAGDVYSLGVLLHECLTGLRPFAAPTLDSLYRRILDGNALRADGVNPAVPRDLALIAAVAMDRDPARRYATAEAFADDLRRWAEHRPILARPAGALLRLLRWWQRSPAFATVLLALALSLCAGFGASLWLWRSAAAAGERSARLLAEWESLADLRRLGELVQEAEVDLWPAIPGKLPAIEAWLRRADELAGRVAGHATLLERLQREAAAGAGESDEAAWRRHRLEELVRGLLAFTAPDPFGPTLASVQRRRGEAATILARSVAAPASAWAAAIARVRAHASYHGLELVPQLGLVPLGADPQTRLEEFADLRTGDLPRRQHDGTLECGEASAVVFVLLPGGAFTMGAQAADANAPNHDRDALLVEQPTHRVVLAPFLLSKFELTQAQWQTVMGDNPSRAQPGRGPRGVTVTRRHPVENMTWEQAAAFARRCGFVLPTEAQWEYACRAGTSTPWSSGAEPASLLGVANFADEGSRREYPPDWACEAGTDDGHAVTAPVGTYQANRFGLHDMHGNVREWCREGIRRYDTPVLPDTGERVPPANHAPQPGQAQNLRVVRGGSCATLRSQLRSAVRGWEPATAHMQSLGLRPVRQLDR